MLSKRTVALFLHLPKRASKSDKKKAPMLLSYRKSSLVLNLVSWESDPRSAPEQLSKPKVTSYWTWPIEHMQQVTLIPHLNSCVSEKCPLFCPFITELTESDLHTAPELLSYQKCSSLARTAVIARSDHHTAPRVLSWQILRKHPLQCRANRKKTLIMNPVLLS
jgi:hypothetical protein